MSKLKKIALLLAFVTALSGCASPLPPASVPMEVQPPKLPSPPADVMVKREPNFLSRLLNFLSDSPLSQTK